MNKLERLTGIVFLLSRKAKVQAREMAELFEVSERTIYRDIQALSELRIPIIAETGNNGGYSIEDNYFLQPIVLTDQECQALLLGCEFIQAQKGFPLAKPAALAIEKLTALLPPVTLAALQALAGKITYKVPVAAASAKLSQLLADIKQAMESRQTVEITYQTPNSLAPTLRKVDIYRLFFEQDAWHILGFCHLRRTVRQFKVTRIKALRSLDAFFTLENWTPPSELQSTSAEPMIIRIQPGTPSALKVKESPSFKSFIKLNPEDPTSLYLHFPAPWFSTSYVVETVLGFGKDAEIISPATLREQFQLELRQMLNHYLT